MPDGDILDSDILIEDDSVDLPRNDARLIAVGGGRGGVGKSLVAGSLAVYFAQLGKPVILVDADPTGANLHTHFGARAALREPPVDPVASHDTAAEDRTASAWSTALTGTSVPGLQLLPAAHDSVAAPTALRASRKHRWLHRLRALPAELIVIDVGPGHGAVSVDLLLAADMGIVVTVPEPPAIEETYRFIRAAFVRRVRRALSPDKFRLGLFDKAMQQIGHLASPVDLSRALTKVERELSRIAWTEVKRMRLSLVVNQTRVRSDQDLGQQMCSLVGRHYSVELDELGHIEHDDTVWLSVRKHRPLLIDSPSSKASRNIERIARRVLAVVTAKAPPGVIPTAIPMGRPTLYETLALGRSAIDEEVRRAYKRVKETYAPGSLATSSLLSDAELELERTRIEEAYDTLLDPLRRRAYDLSTFPDLDDPPDAQAKPRPALLAEQAMLENELAREIGPDTEFTGALLRKVREAHGVDAADISQRTKIGKAHILAIEEESFDALPAPVYVRGFVAEIAKFLHLDPPQVQRTYMRRMRERLAGRGRSDD
jgi:flagellar biosynthesis protein FlhG